MHLTVIADDSRRLEPMRDGYTLRLTGPPEASDARPPGLAEARDRAVALVRSTYFNWLWHWVQNSGLLELATCPGPISWWWYSPASEMSPSRSPLIRDLYWLALVRVVVAEHSVTNVTWCGDDHAVSDAAGMVVRALGATFVRTVGQGAIRRPVWMRLAGRLRAGVRQVCRSAALRAAGLGSSARQHANVLLYSRYPVLWEVRQGEARERMYAEWPACLATHGLKVVYGALFTGGVFDLVTRLREIRHHCQTRNIILLDALATVREVVAAHCDVRFLWRYLRFRFARRHETISFDGMDVTASFWREMDANALNAEVPQDRVLEAVMRRTIGGTGVTSVCLPFEYQPMERAVTVAAHRCGVPVIGLQTGFVGNQMAWCLPPSRVLAGRSDAGGHLPDYLVAYGDTPYHEFAARVGVDRVCLAGPIRYVHLVRPPTIGRQEVFRKLGIATDATMVLVATSSDRAESLAMLESTFAAIAPLSRVVLAVRFHYHQLLHAELDMLAGRFPAVVHRVPDGVFDDLLGAASALICGATSSGIEAMARGCMPLVFRPIGEVSANPILDASDAVFFWQWPDELAHSLALTLSEDQEFLRRRARWPETLRAHFSPLVPDMNARLFEWLRARGAISGADDQC